MDFSEWTPFIQNGWFRKQFMKFVYLLMIFFFLAPNWFGAQGSFISSSTQFIKFPLILLVIVCVFITHELLHILVIHRKGDISLTYSGIFFWLNTNAILSKMRFWIFISLPYIVLSVIPAIVSLFITGNIKALLLFICWMNLIISSADIINSFLIIIKPNNSVFCRGYYRRHN